MNLLEFLVDVFNMMIDAALPVFRFLDVTWEIPEFDLFGFSYPGGDISVAALVFGTGLYVVLVISIVKWLIGIIT